MRIKSIKAWAGTETEALLKKVKVIKIEQEANDWDKVFYKVPRGRKLYSIFLKSKGYELED